MEWSRFELNKTSYQVCIDFVRDHTAQGSIRRDQLVKPRNVTPNNQSQTVRFRFPSTSQATELSTVHIQMCKYTRPALSSLHFIECNQDWRMLERKPRRATWFSFHQHSIERDAGRPVSTTNDRPTITLRWLPGNQTFLTTWSPYLKSILTTWNHLCRNGQNNCWKRKRKQRIYCCECYQSRCWSLLKHFQSETISDRQQSNWNVAKQWKQNTLIVSPFTSAILSASLNCPQWARPFKYEHCRYARGFELIVSLFGRLSICWTICTLALTRSLATTMCTKWKPSAMRTWWSVASPSATRTSMPARLPPWHCTYSKTYSSLKLRTALVNTWNWGLASILGLVLQALWVSKCPDIVCSVWNL